MAIILIIGENSHEQARRKPQIMRWLKVLKQFAGDIEVRIWPDVGNAEDIEYAVVWNQPLGVFNNFPNLRAITSLGAGVNHIFHDPHLPADIPILRVIDHKLSRDMAHYVVQTVLNRVRMQERFIEGQQLREWRQQPPFTLVDETTVGVMGLGEIGAHIAQSLQGLAIPVIGWSRTQKDLAGIECYDEADFDEFLSKTNLLICALPLTPQTEDIINRDTLAKLPKGAFVVNIARGKHVVDDDLIAALDTGHIDGAKLDVFRDEPLPPENPLWRHPKIIITPHTAGVSEPSSCAQYIIENYRRLINGDTLEGVVDRERGY